MAHHPEVHFATKPAEEFMAEYNNQRPHEALNNQTPMEYAA